MARCALIILDMQKGNFMEPQPIFNGEKLVAKIVLLINKMRSVHIPIVYIQNNGGSGDPDEPGTAGWEIHPSIEPRKGDLVIQKSYPDAFQGTVLKKELDSRGIKKIIMVGLQSEFCIDTTCRRAFSLNYDVILVEDAHSTWPSELLTPKQIISHHNSVLGDWFVTLKKTYEILKEELG
ncbi:MAG: cysteine hydrolase family protein [Candidatus Hodarchaeota archaeon]